MGQPRNREEILRDEWVRRDRILELVRESPRTIPELADALGAPSSEVILWVMGMRRYGLLEESKEADDEGFYRYAPTSEV